MRLFLFLILLLYSTAGYTDTQVPPLNFNVCKTSILLYGKPLHNIRQTAPICRHAYALEYNIRYKTPAWVAYILRPEYTVGCLKRDDNFVVDRSLHPLHRSTTSDFDGGIYDIGHMVSASDMSWDELVMRETFILTNAVPQLAGFNRGIWRRLEEQTRAWAQERKHDLLVYTGPIYYTKTPNTIGKNRIAVPDAFYKVIIDTQTKEVLPFIFVHTPVRADMDLFIVGMPRVEHETGIRFPLPKDYVQSMTLWDYRLKSTRIARSIICATSGN